MNYQAKYKINEFYFDEINTQEKAYILGFFYADANHTKNGRKNTIRLALHNKDIEILEKINCLLEHDKPIRFNRQMAELEIANKHISDTMLIHGLEPKKTFTLKYPKWIQLNLQWHFIRGYFDGDGSIGLYNPPSSRGKSKIASFSLVSTESFCLSISNIFKEELNIVCKLRTRFPERCNNTRMIQIGGNIQVRRILDKLYDNATIFLNRKYSIYQEFRSQQDEIHCDSGFA